LTLDMVGGQPPPWQLYLWEVPVRTVQEAGWAPGLGWTGAENIATPRFYLRIFQLVASHYIDWAIAALCVLDEFKTNKIKSHDLNWGSGS
jgi:hypothetical protein